MLRNKNVGSASTRLVRSQLVLGWAVHRSCLWGLESGGWRQPGPGLISTVGAVSVDFKD